MNARIIKDLGENQHEKGTLCLAEQEMEDGTLQIFFRTEHDIQILIERLKSQPGILEKPNLLTRDFWLLTACNRMAGERCFLGDCAPRPPEWEPGSCNPFSIGDVTACWCEYTTSQVDGEAIPGCC